MEAATVRESVFVWFRLHRVSEPVHFVKLK
jgi:hypothetical protein